TVNGGPPTTITTLVGNSVSISASTTAGTYVYELLSVADANGCWQAQTGTVTVIVNPIPSCSITGPNSVGINSNGNNYTVKVSPGGGTVTYAWSITGKGSISGSTTGSSVSVSAGGAGTYTLTVDIVRNGCPSECTIDVTVTDMPCSISGADNV